MRKFSCFFHSPLYNPVTLWYTVNMRIRQYLQQLFLKRRIKKSGLEFPVYDKIHGVKSSDRQGALAQSSEGDELQIVHVPLKNFPHNAYVYSIPLNRVLGYLERETAEKLLYVFKENYCLDGEIVKITGGEPYTYFGCKIFIFPTTDLLADTEDFSHLYGE